MENWFGWSNFYSIWSWIYFGNPLLSSRFSEDKKNWAATSNGIFGVRSAYKIAVQWSSSEPEAVGFTSDDSSTPRSWKKLWRLLVPHKICHFAWRACRDILPTKENLMHRHVIEEIFCEVCKSEVESSGHFFWTCLRD